MPFSPLRWETIRNWSRPTRAPGFQLRIVGFLLHIWIFFSLNLNAVFCTFLLFTILAWSCRNWRWPPRSSPSRRSCRSSLTEPTCSRWWPSVYQCPPVVFISGHWRRVNTEEKAKVVAAVWGAHNLSNSLPCKLFCTRTILKNMINSSFSSNHPRAIHHILQIILCGKECLNSAPQTAAMTFTFSYVFFHDLRSPFDFVWELEPSSLCSTFVRASNS